jgi:glycosyltransferase involved in cell wall biosynthesis
MSADRLAVVMPVYNEAAVIEQVIGEWQAALGALGVEAEWIVVDDGSRDSTADVLGRLPVRVVRQTNAGHGAACRRGYQEAVASNADWVLQIDSDGQCDPAYFPDFWQARAGHDCVFGRRSTRADGTGRRFVSFVCRTLVGLLAGVRAPDFNVPYRLMRRTALASALPRVHAGFELQNVGLTVALLRQPELRWQWLSIHFRARAGGQNSLNWRGIVRLALRLLRQRGALRS